MSRAVVLEVGSLYGHTARRPSHTNIYSAPQHQAEAGNGMQHATLLPETANPRTCVTTAVMWSLNSGSDDTTSTCPPAKLVPHRASLLVLTVLDRLPRTYLGFRAEGGVEQKGTE